MSDLVYLVWCSIETISFLVVRYLSSVATKLVTQLAVLTARTRPGDLVQVSSLRGAMGLPAENEAPSLSSPQDPMSPPSQSATDTDQQHTNST